MPIDKFSADMVELQSGKSVAEEIGISSKKLSGTINVAEYGIVSDGTDQTTQLVDLFSNTLGANYRGNVTIPFNTKFNIPTVYDSLPVGVVLRDESSINYRNSDTYKKKVVVIGSKDVNTDDTEFMVMSGHNTALTLNNLGNAGTPSATDRKNTIKFGCGLFDTGSVKDYFMLQTGKHTAYDAWLMKIASTLKYLDQTTPVDQSIFGIDEMGRMGVGQLPTQAFNFAVLNAGVDTSTTTAAKVENTNNGSVAELHLKCKDSGGVSKGKIFRITNNNYLSLRKNDNSTSVWQIDDNGNGRYFKGVSGSAFTTAARPTGTIEIGTMIFDTDLGKPIWFKGAGVWVDATGATV